MIHPPSSAATLKGKRFSLPLLGFNFVFHWILYFASRPGLVLSVGKRTQFHRSSIFRIPPSAADFLPRLLASVSLILKTLSRHQWQCRQSLVRQQLWTTQTAVIDNKRRHGQCTGTSRHRKLRVAWYFDVDGSNLSILTCWHSIRHFGYWSLTMRRVCMNVYEEDFISLWVHRTLPGLEYEESVSNIVSGIVNQLPPLHCCCCPQSYEMK